MLPTFRILFVAAGLTVLIVMMASRGLVPTPEAHTRIGEVPSVARSLVQQAMVPRLSVGPSIVFAEERAPLREATGSAPVIVATPAGSVEAREGGVAAAPASPSDPQAEGSDALGDLIRTILAETPEPAARAESELASPSPSAPMPAEKAETAKGPAAAGPPALAFGAEPKIERKAAAAPAGERTAATTPQAEPGMTATPAPAPAETKAAKPESSRKAAAKQKPRAAKKAVAKKQRMTKRKVAAKPVVRKKARLVHAARRNRHAAKPSRRFDPITPTVNQTAPGVYQATPSGYHPNYDTPSGSTILR
jgi:hypothetical protein